LEEEVRWAAAAGRDASAELGRSRRELFEELDRPALIPLPDEPYEYAEWKHCRVNLDYHVEIARHYYSVPHYLVHQEVEARITARMVEIFLRGEKNSGHASFVNENQQTGFGELCKGAPHSDQTTCFAAPA
jgi:transposase